MATSLIGEMGLGEPGSFFFNHASLKCQLRISAVSLMTTTRVKYKNVPSIKQ